MNRFVTRSVRSSSFHHSSGSFMGLSFGLLLAASLLAPGCKKDDAGGDTTAPGKSREEIEQAVAAAKQQAKVEGLIELANQDLQAGRYVSATRRAEEALAANPEDANAYAVLGAAKWRAGDYEASTAAYRKALELKPNNFGASLGLARNLQAAGKHEEAIELQTALLKDDETQVDPRLMLLWSYYATCNAKDAVPVLDEIFKRLPADDAQLPLIQAHAAFLRPFADKGPLCQVEGEQGSTDVAIAHDIGLKHSGVIVGDQFTRALFLEMREETVIDEQFAAELGLEPIGKFKPLGSDAEASLVLIPEIKIGELRLKNIPALVQPLEGYAASVGEKPGLMLGRQALAPLGTLAFDFPSRSLTVAKATPKNAPEGAAEAPLLLVSMHVLQAPAMPIKINGSEHEFYAYLGGVYKAGLAITEKHYLKSGELPRDVLNPDDPDAGLKMVYIDSLTIGDQTLPGVGGLVLVNDPPDQNLGLFLENTAFELGGYVNLALMETWKVTYALRDGKVYVVPSVPKV